MKHTYLIRMKKDIAIKKIAPRTIVAFYEDYFELNAGSIILDNFILVIDTLLYPSQTREFRAYLDQNYKQPIKYLLLTHFHGDHLLGMGEFKSNDIEVLGTEQLVDNMKNRLENNWSQESIAKWKEEEPDNTEDFDAIDLFLPHRTFEKSHVIEDGSLRVEFYHSGGHSGCSAWVYFAEDKVIFTGDELASYNWPFISEPSGNPDTWIQAFEHMLSLDVENVVPGHGKIVNKKHLQEHLEYLKTLRSIVLKGIEDCIKVEELVVPEFYKPAEDWQIPKALEHLYNFYSKR
ncbi:MAG: MBL fold metallo-hydrolase [Promethearchaeota archaeon]|nr:MAG: MBL fold metallo-hydrolase [Candidatus Lokiarchaeota archaeon]